MKLVTFVVADGSEHIGALLDDMLTVSDFTASSDASCFRSMLALIDGGVGMVPAVNLVGRADRVFFSVDGAKLRQSPVYWGTAIRTDRIGAQF